jgi:RNA polymerase sigma factor (sigma-70 family)
MDDPSPATNSGSLSLEAAFRADERLLWGVCYRMTGCAADADDLVQETFVRAIEHPPRRTEAPWRPWLVRIAINLARDLLRRRRRRSYAGKWLPAPIETGEEASPPAHEPVIDGTATTEGRYDLLESVSFAFLLALEALSPQQRAVLLLRDVFDYSVREVASALDISEANVKTTHHRARAAMRAYDRDRCVPTRDLQARTRTALEQFVASLMAGDLPAIESQLAASVRAVADGAGEVFAGRKPLVGPHRVALFYRNLTHRHVGRATVAMRMINGLPALVIDASPSRPKWPHRFVVRCDVDQAGRITAVHSILARRKLTAIRFGWGSDEAVEDDPSMRVGD